jgi:hypothetical protein
MLRSQKKSELQQQNAQYQFDAREAREDAHNQMRPWLAFWGIV